MSGLLSEVTLINVTNLFVKVNNLAGGLCHILLKDLENYIRNHPEARLAKIQEIGRHLVDDRIMPQIVQSDVEAITSRWSHMSQQVGVGNYLLAS